MKKSGKLDSGWQTAGVVFVADAFGVWLVEQLADAGRKKLTELILGSEQERALRRAADAAVWATAEEMSPSGGEQAGQVAMVISEVFRDPGPGAPLAGPVMLLAGLQAGIGGQLAVLDNAELTGTGRSSADVLGVPGAVLADSLTGYLVREIIVRGSGGGPLTPLADQLNHELTRLQIEGMFVRLAGEVRDALARPGSDVTVAGRPLEEVTDPFVLEVHRPVQPEDAPLGLSLLPPYVPREHDQVLGQVVRAAADGRSGIAVLVGGSSTGKTRACWEALALLRDQDPPWRLWHPIDPSRPDAALAELPGIGPRTVVWLNEAQFYLDAEAGLGERVAAGLRELLRDPGRAPVLVLATLWLEYWDALTARPADGDDRHPQARELLAGHDITVPAAFTLAQMSQLAHTADVRMALAARSARDGEVIQFLAGAPELLARYRNASAAAKALIHAAMDARRLGMGASLPQAFLEAAAPGYLTDDQWDALGEDWLEQALAYTAVPCKGARGPLTRIRPRPAGHAARHCGDQSGSMATVAGPLYRLADYLDQYGRAHRASQIPPVAVWDALTVHALNPGDQARAAQEAQRRGLYRYAVALARPAAEAGDSAAMQLLAFRLDEAGHADEAAQWRRRAAEAGEPVAVQLMAKRLDEKGDHEGAEAILRNAAARGDTSAILSLAGRLDAAGERLEAEHLLAQRAGSGDTVAMENLEARLRREGRCEEAEVWLRRAAEAGDIFAMQRLAGRLDEVGQAEEAGTWLVRAAEMDDHFAHFVRHRLYLRLDEAGRPDEADRWLRRDIEAGDTSSLWILAGRLEQAGQAEEAEVHRQRARDAGEFMALVPAIAEIEQAGGGLDDFEQLLRHPAEAGEPFAMQTLATKYDEAGREAEANQWLGDLARVGNLVALHVLGGRLELANRYGEAERVWRRIIELGNPAGVQNLAQRLERDDPDRADNLRRYGIEPGGSTAAPW